MEEVRSLEVGGPFFTGSAPYKYVWSGSIKGRKEKKEGGG
jgi:hypothetical protein